MLENIPKKKDEEECRENLDWRLMKGKSCRIQQYQLCGIGMLRLSHEFIKILDEEMDRLWNVCDQECRKYVPVGSIALDKSLVAGVDVYLQNKLPIIKA